MKKIKAIWFDNGEQGYNVGTLGVISITEFRYAGSMGYYPWFRVKLESEGMKELNSTFVEEVVYEKEISDSTGEERRETSTEETINQAGGSQN